MKLKFQEWDLPWINILGRLIEVKIVPVQENFYDQIVGLAKKAILQASFYGMIGNAVRIPYLLEAIKMFVAKKLAALLSLLHIIVLLSN